MYTNKQLWQIAQQRFMIDDPTDTIATEAELDEFLAAMPQRLPKETFSEWLKRGRKFNGNTNLRYITEIQRLAADSRETEDPLPEMPLMATNQQFQLSVTPVFNHKLKLSLKAFGLASSRFAHRKIGIAATHDGQVIAELQLDAYGDGIDETLDDTPAHRHVLLHPYILLIEDPANA